MVNFLQKITPMIVVMAISMIIYLKIDKDNKYSKKIKSYIKVKNEWKSVFCIVCMFILIFLIALIPMADSIIYMLYGIIIGVGIPITTKVESK